jgi:ATP-dependent RNA helicase RhlE
VQRRRGAVRALILTPTRELAVQILESFRSYGRHLGLRSAVVFGGVGQQPQVEALSRGLDILVATPGRLLDLMEQRHVDLRDVSIFVLDEADRMLDMGFIHDVKRIVATLPKERQTLFFSATMPGEIERLAGGILKDPIRIAVTPAATTVERIDQRVYFVAAANKNALLAELLKDQAIERVLVFTRTKHGADRVTKHIQRVGIEAQAIHGNKSQNARQRALADFRDGQTRVLVATDIAARGIDVDGITHVINFEIPNVPETYVHRIGRTARAGKDGIALSFCDHSEKSLLRDVEKLTRKPLSIVDQHGFHAVPAARTSQPQDRPNGQRPQHQGSGRPQNARPQNARPQNGRQQNARQQQPAGQRAPQGEQPVQASRHQPQPSRHQPPQDGAASPRPARPHRHRRRRPHQAQVQA